MYPILILRSELACLVILVFLFFTSRSYNLNRESVAFRRILNFGLLHVFFDIITVITVNATYAVPGVVNWICHIFFYLSAIFFANEVANYVTALCYPQFAKRLYGFGHILIVLYICSLSFLEIRYESSLGTWSSTGPAAYVGYGLAFSFFIFAFAVLLVNFKTISPTVKRPLIPMMLVLMVTEVAQILERSVLFTGGAVSIVTVGLFFSLENPVAVFQKKAMTDALTGVRSRSSYEEEIDKLDKHFKKKPSEDFTFVFCDLNDLRSVNNRFGHAEGDNYITLIASAIRDCTKHSSAVYRIGGDEFLIFYFRVAEDVVEQEINNLQDMCAKASENLPYTAAITAGYAKSTALYSSLRDVVKTADYVMYQNKANKKSGVPGSLGMKINCAGLTDKIFDALCASNVRSYPFITNLDTNVTRISPAWKKYFDMPDEFYNDFLEYWKTRIHPDYVEGYIEDILAVVNGHRKYHGFEYFAKRANGDYVKVGCRGSVFRDSGNGINYFCGFMENFGLDDNIDSATGLENFTLLTARNLQYLENGKPFSLLKLKLNNMARINMLYGYNVGNEVIKRMAKILVTELGNRGKVYCQNAVNFTLLMDTDDEQTVKDFYRVIASVCSAGLVTDSGLVPILISGGAYVSRGELHDIDRIRGGLVYALEESQYYQRNALVFYHDLDKGNDGNDIALLAVIHADALGDMKYFRLRYQPIVNVATRKTVGAEALLRWVHPEYGEIPPAKFIAFIENDACYYRLGLFILDQAIHDAKKMCEKIPGFRINVNITALQLQNENFADDVFDVLNKYNFEPNGLVLELTERCKEMDGKFLAAKISELRRRGVLVAFDDLGTGYSTINLLMDIPVDEIKLDRNFVRDISSRENYQLFVRTLVLGSSTHGNNYSICFEGIENVDMLDLVSNYGEFLAQGYYFAKPLLIDEFSEYIENEA